MLVGDLNISHKHIDHCDPYPEFETLSSRIWMDQFVLSITRQPVTPQLLASLATEISASSGLQPVICTEDKSATIELEYLLHDQTIIDMLNEPFSQEKAPSQSDQIKQAKDDASLEPALRAPTSTPFMVDMFRYFQPTRKQAFTCW